MALILPDEFQFSQSALQDYVDCHRRFYLRHVLRQRYPARVPAHARLRGAAGPGRTLPSTCSAASDWCPGRNAAHRARRRRAGRVVDRYLNTALAGLPPQRYAELSLTLPLADRRLVAKFDLLAAQPGEAAVIVDWKTAPRPGRARNWPNGGRPSFTRMRWRARERI